VAAHVLARARYAAEGRFGLRVTASGFGTPAYGPRNEVLRIAGPMLVHERQDPAPGARATSILGRSLRDLASFADVDLMAPFDAGSESPPLGDPDVPLGLAGEQAGSVLAWLRLGAEALDRLLLVAMAPSIVQLWPEHFDVGFDVATGHGRANLGASPGDASHLEPYLYVGPWEDARPDDPSYWNASFGAVLEGRSVLAAPEPVAAAAAFFARGLEFLG
jgi:hypothetical protein